MSRRIQLVLCVVLLFALSSLSVMAAISVDLVGRLPYGDAKDVFMVGKYAYVCMGRDLVVLDVGNPANPIKVGACDITSPTRGVFVGGAYAYVAAADGLYVVYNYNPANPLYSLTITGVEKIAYNPNISDICVDQSLGFAYIGTTAGLYKIDVSIPSSPNLIGTAFSANNIQEVACYQGVVYFSIPDAGTNKGIWKIEGGGAPTNLYSIAQAARFSVLGDYIYARVIKAPNFVKIHRTTGAETSLYNLPNYPTKVFVVGNYAYFTGSLRRLNLNNGNIDVYNAPNTATSCFVSGSNIYLAAGAGQFKVYDATASTLNSIGEYVTPDIASSAFADDFGYAYLANGPEGMSVVNVSRPTNPVQVGSFDSTPRAIWKVYVLDNIAFLASVGGIYTVDVSVKDNPTLIGFAPSTGNIWASGVFAADINGSRYAYLATDAGLDIYSISVSGVPTHVGVGTQGYYSTGGNWAFDVVVAKGNDNEIYAYLAAENGLHVVKITNPAAPVLAGNPAHVCSTDGFGRPIHARGVTLIGNYAYVVADEIGGNAYDGLYTIDIDVNVAGRPIAVGYFPMPCDNTASGGIAAGIDSAGNYLYVALGLTGFHVFNINTPTSPYREVTYPPNTQNPINAYGVSISGKYAYVTGYNDGMYIFTANVHTIIATAGSHGKISPAGKVHVLPGRDQSFTITPDKGYSIKKIKITASNGSASNASLPADPSKKYKYTFFNVSGDGRIDVTFEETEYSITATAGSNGGISPSGTITKNYGEDAAFTFIPITGYTIGQVLLDGVAVTPVNNKYTISNITASHAINVAFEPTKLTITATAGTNGKITPSGPIQVNYGSNQAFLISADAGFTILDVLVDGVSVGAVGSYPFANITGDHTITATFAPIRIITATAGSGGAISPFGTTQVADGGSKKFTMTANTGYHLADIKVNGTSVGAATAEYTFTNVKANQTIEAMFLINTYIVTATAGTGGTITPSGQVIVTHGGSQSFSIVPNVGYTIADVKVDGTSVGAVPSHTITNITGSKAIDATFTINTYNITTSAGAGGSITPAGVVKVNHGADQTFAITPADGYNIADVRADGVSVGSIATNTFTNVIAPHTISATFAIKTFKITATATGNGTITPAGDTVVNYGGAQTYTITPKEGHFIKDVIADGNSVGVMNSYTFGDVKSNRTINAVFSPNIYILRSSSVGKGIVTPSGESKASYGQDATFTITADPGYFASIVKIDGVITEGITDSYKFTNIAKNHAIIVTFSLKSYKITSSAGANGSISPLGDVSVNHGGSQKYTITPNTGYSIADVSVDGVSVGAVGSNEFTNVTADHTISATFAINSYKITSTAGANGSITPLGDVTLNYGGSQEYLIAVDANYHIADVKVNGVSVGAVKSHKFTNVSANHTIAATFAIDTFNITASAGASGTMSPTGTVTVNYGSNQVFNMTPMVGYKVTDILVDGVSAGAANSYTFTNVTANRTISVTFGMSVYTITASAIGPGTITPSGEIKINHAGMKIFTMKPNDGARLVDVKVDGHSMGPLLSYQFGVIVANHTIVATFEQKANVPASALMQNFPNPFNPETWIPYALKNDGEVKVSIYDSIGRLVRELNLGQKNAGIYATPNTAAYWDGKDQFGIPAASGVYFYRIQAGDFSSIKKMIVMK